MAGVAASLAPAVAQREVEAFARRMHPSIDADRIQKVFANSGIEQRHLAQPVEWYATTRALSERNRLASDLACTTGP